MHKKKNGAGKKLATNYAEKLRAHNKIICPKKKTSKNWKNLLRILARKRWPMQLRYCGSSRRFSRRPTKTGWLQTCVGFIGSFGGVENIWLKIVQIKLTTWRLFDICVCSEIIRFFFIYFF